MSDDDLEPDANELALSREHANESPETCNVREEIERRIDCPLDWCAGAWLAHGGDGAEPDQWLHEAEHAIGLPHGAGLDRSRLGAGPDEWSLAMQGDGARYSMGTALDPRELAVMLRDVADAVDRARPV